MLKTYTIELRIDANKECQEVALAECRRAAKMLIASMSLMADKRKPQVALSTEDMFEGTEQLSIFEEGEQENPL